MTNEANTTNPSMMRSAFAQLGPHHLLSVLVLVSAIVAVVMGMMMWGDKTGDFRVLYSNLSDRDGGAIIESLQQQNIPYKFAEGGGALLVPAEKVHEIRLRMASQGLPKGGTAGFELMENQKFGTSQFLEQVNYQRSLEGELSRSMQTLGSVQTARVHLAIPKPSVFVKDQQKPSASVVLTLHPGRTLDVGQVNAIVHLISSSIPNMPSGSVTVVDQTGTLLSSLRQAGEDSMDESQLKYIRKIEQGYIKRIEEIVAPLIGAQNVRVQVTADVDFSRIEQTAESFKPNLQANQSSVRSTQIAESQNGVVNPAGVPGALSNQPPVPATAPVVSPANAAAGSTGENTSQHKEATTNYEVDRTISYTKQPVGNIRRLSVAVLINNRTTTDSKGKVISVPFTPAEQAQLNTLVRNAMGFNAQRGDSLNLLNSAFNEIAETVEPEIPLWQQPEIILLGKEWLKYLLMLVVGMLLYFKVLRPMYRNLVDILTPLAPPPTPRVDHAKLAADAQAEEKEYLDKQAAAAYDNSLQTAKQIAKEKPTIVAAVVKEWVSS